MNDINPIRITVLMAVYNCADTLVEALDSLYNQTYRNFKLVICDDASTDDTFTIVQNYSKTRDNITLIKNQKNLKLASSLNRCLEYADTEYVARMDGDDISLPDRFQKQIDFLDTHEDFALVSCPMIYFDETGDWGIGNIEEFPNKFTFRKGTPHPHAPSMIRTSVIKEVEGYTVNKYLARGQDYYLWYKIYKAGYRGYNIQEHLYKMRDDQEAMARRTLKSRYYSFIVKKSVIKDLGMQNSFFYALPNLIKGFVPKFVMKSIRKRLMKNSKH